VKGRSRETVLEVKGKGKGKRGFV